MVFPTFSSQLISADDQGFLYTGRVDFSEPNKPLISWPGTSIKANFSSTSLVIVLDDEKGKNYFNVILNGQGQFPAVISLKKGLHEYDLSYLLFNQSNAVTQIEIYKRTEGHEGGTHFLGLKLDDNAKLLAPPKSLNRKIAFFGDSITSGMGNEGANNGDDNLESEKNHYWSYAAITARNLNAEFHSISLSGIGIMVSWFDFIMPQYFDQLSAAGNNQSEWNFTQWQPEVVVVNLGQNDSWLIDNEKRLEPAPTERNIIDAYKTFMLELRAVYPKAQFISALGSMDATKAERKHWVGYVKTAISELNKQNKHNQIEFIAFDFTGYQGHPRIAQHIQNADKLSTKIKSLMQW